METRDESPLAVLRLFGREPMAEDWRCVGRWAYAAAWVSEDRPTARTIARARLSGAADLAVRAAMSAGRSEGDRYTLVSALARLKDAIQGGEGPMAEVAARLVGDMADAQLADGNTLRAATKKERAAFAPRFSLESFVAAMKDAGSERSVLMREAARSLDEALMETREACPALRTLRLYLQVTRALDAHEAPDNEAASLAGKSGVIRTLAMWLTADLALASRKSPAFEAAWGTAARTAGDALSRTVSGLASGTMMPRGGLEALRDDPVALVLALAMTSEAGHASALLDFAVQAQVYARAEARAEADRWAAQVRKFEETEARLGVSLTVGQELREGHREGEAAGAMDLFSAWGLAEKAREAKAALREAMARGVSAEATRRREAVRKAKSTLERTKAGYDALIDEARAKMSLVVERPVFNHAAEESAQRGCVFGFGAGCSVLATYVAVGIVVGTGGLVGRIAPVVVAVAALPVVAAVMAQLAVAIRRAAANAEAGRRRAAATAEYERAREAAERSYGPALRTLREALEAAEESLGELERRMAQGVS